MVVKGSSCESSRAVCSFTWRWVSQLRAYESGVVMRISSDNSSLVFTGFLANRVLGPPLFSGEKTQQGVSNQGSFWHTLMPISQYKCLQTSSDRLRM